MGSAAPKGNQYRTGKTYPRKECINCGIEKAVSKFPKRGGLTYGDLPALDPRRYDSQCKLCKKPVPAGKSRKDLKEPKRKYTKKKKRKRSKRDSKQFATNNEYRAHVRMETRVRSMIYLASKGCECCDERDPRKLEYDHKEPSDKKYPISRLITTGYSWASAVLRREIRKCRILCANCHRKHTIEQQGYLATEAVKSTLSELSEEYGFDL